MVEALGRCFLGRSSRSQPQFDPLNGLRPVAVAFVVSSPSAATGFVSFPAPTLAARGSLRPALREPRPQGSRRQDHASEPRAQKSLVGHVERTCFQHPTVPGARDVADGFSILPHHRPGLVFPINRARRFLALHHRVEAERADGRDRCHGDT